MAHGASVAVFLAQIVTLLIAGRLLGELMQRIGQPAVMGQLIAGVLLGPSVLGAVAPGFWHSLFAGHSDQHAMLDAVAQLGILLLLLMTGMETDLAVFRDARRTAISISLAGIVLPFGCGIALGLLLPDSLLPDPSKRFITTLFLGTALSISSVKIVALVVRDLGFLRRTVGQMIVAAAVIDDTIGWIIMSVIFGLALHGKIDVVTLARSVIGTALFLAVSFTVGRQIVFQLIRWANDSFISEMPVISMILAIAVVLALLTDAIGVHFVLGAFVAGILIGQSPILTGHINEQLRGLIVAVFMPVFFGVAGLTTDVSVLGRPDMMLLTLGLIALASIGKFTGAFVGGRVGGLTYSESLAVGCGMNARGSTEVIVASIGLSMGALNQSLFTAIVAMAVLTTLSMPPLLRWSLGRLPLGADERSRLEREEREAQSFVTHIERLLVAVDASPSGRLASRLVGLLAGVRRIPTTVLHFDGNDRGKGDGEPAANETRADAANEAKRTDVAVKAAAEEGDDAAEQSSTTAQFDIRTRSEKAGDSEDTIATEARKGYGLLFVGREPTLHRKACDPQITQSVTEFGGAFAIALARGKLRAGPDPSRPDGLESPLHILVPISGTRASRDGAELALALAQASRGSVTALFVDSSTRRQVPWSARFGAVLLPTNIAEAAVREVTELGELYDIPVEGQIRKSRAAENAILREIDRGRHSLVVMGVSPRTADQLFFGDVAAQLLDRAPCSILLVSSEPAISTPARGHARAKDDRAPRDDRRLPSRSHAAE